MSQEETTIDQQPTIEQAETAVNPFSEKSWGEVPGNVEAQSVETNSGQEQQQM